MSLLTAKLCVITYVQLLSLAKTLTSWRAILPTSKKFIVDVKDYLLPFMIINVFILCQFTASFKNMLLIFQAVFKQFLYYRKT